MRIPRTPIFGESASGDTTRVYQLKRDLLALEKTVSPLVEVCNRLMRFELPFVPEDTRLYFRDVYDHIFPLNETIDAQRELLTTALEAILSMMSHTQNDHHESHHGVGRDDIGAHDDRRDLWNELPQHAGTELELRLPRVHRRHGRRLC